MPYDRADLTISAFRTENTVNTYFIQIVRVCKVKSGVVLLVSENVIPIIHQRKCHPFREIQYTWRNENNDGQSRSSTYFSY